MKATTCPFCGLATDVPHNTQESCIEALHGEIAKMRRILDSVRPSEGPASQPRGKSETEIEPV